MGKNKIDYELDLSGLLCPWPLLKLQEQILELPVGTILQVITSDPSSKVDFGVYARQSSHKLLQSWQVGDKYYYLFKK